MYDQFSENGNHPWNKKTQLEIVKLAFGHSRMATHPPLSQNFVVETEGVSCVFYSTFLLSKALARNTTMPSLNSRMPTLRFRVAFFYSMGGLRYTRTSSNMAMRQARPRCLEARKKTILLQYVWTHKLACPGDLDNSWSIRRPVTSERTLSNA